MAALFGLCEALYVEGFDVPAEAEFCAGAVLDRASIDDRDEDDAAAQFCDVLDRDSSADEPMTYWVRVLLKYRALVVAAGRDY